MKNLQNALDVERLEERYETSALGAMITKCVASGNDVQATK
jgi:hypothetical protein